MITNVLLSLIAFVACSADGRRVRPLLNQDELAKDFLDTKDPTSLNLLLLALQPRVVRSSAFQSNRLSSSSHQANVARMRNSRLPSNTLTDLRYRSPVSPVMQEVASFIDSPRWPEIKTQLDALPVFTVANEEKKPLQYTVGTQTVAMFYVDISAAKSALETAMTQFPDLDSDVIQIGLGTAYALSTEGKAIIVPGVSELSFLGMPEGMSAVGQELPLLACMDISHETEDGKSATPLYMSIEDCQKVVEQAREETERDKQELNIVGLTLPSVIEHLSQNGGQAFTFVAPSSSTEHIDKYVGKGVYYRVVEED